MILCRELTFEEVEVIARECSDYGGYIDPQAFAKALFEAARVNLRLD